MNNLIMISLKMIFFSFLVFLLANCNSPLDDIKEVKLENDDAEWAIPLVNSKTDLQNLFDRLGKSESLIIYPDGNMSFFYKGNILTKTAKDVIAPLEEKLTNVFFPITKKHDTIIPEDLDQLIRQALITGDDLFFVFNALPNDNRKIIVTASMPNMMDKNGVVFSISDTSDGVTRLELEKSMSGFTIYPVDSVGFEVKYEAHYLDGTEATFIEAIMVFKKMTFSFVEGYFSKDEYDVPGDTIDIDLFKDWTDGGVFFRDPRIAVTIDNSFGFPVRTSIKEMKVVSRDGSELPLSSPLIDNGVNIPYPTLDQIGEIKYDTFYFDKNSSNIDQVFNANPVQLIYDIDGVGNPDQDRTITGFVTDSSFFKINVEVELPADGWIEKFELTDTVDISTDLSDVELKEATIKTIIDNGFPIGLTSKLYLLKDGVIIDSLFQENGVELIGAIADQTGTVISSTKTTDFYKLTTENIVNLRQSDNVLVKMFISTSDAPNQTVIIKSSEEIDVKMGIIFSY